ncbi:MAG: sugar phosphate nucleotidyltransferase [archaeon]
MKEKISITLDGSVINQIKNIIDGIYIRNTSQAIEYLLKKTLSGNNKAIFLCGGESNKTETDYFRPCTPFLKTTVIAHNIRFLRSNGFNEVTIIAQKRNLERIEQVLSKEKIPNIDINFVENPPYPKGSMDTLRSAGILTGTTLFAFGDIIFFNNNIQNFWKTHLLYKGTATLYVQAFMKKSGRAGVVTIEGNKITSFVQKSGQEFSLIHFGAVFIAEPNILDYEGHSLEYDIFPKMAKRKDLIGYLSENPIRHFHTEKELKLIEEEIKNL